jgi:probable O-glycosylation ligase (exosortase A-associated)
MPPIRDIFLTGFIFYLIPYCYTHPWIGILAWCWLTFMNPNLLCWGFARTMPFGMILAIPTLLGVMMSRDSERRPIPFTVPTQCLLGLWIIYTFTTIFAWYPAEAWNLWFKVSKILLFVFLSLMYFQNRARLRYLFLVIALSYGFYGLKGALWVVRSANPGAGSVIGPEGGCMTCGNNGLALAFCMTLPFLLFLAREEPRRWLRRVLFAMLLGTPLATLFTFARTGLVTLPAVLIMMFMRSKRKVVAFVALGIFAFGIWNFAPERLFERANSIQTHDDRSSQMRLDSWYVAWRFALDHPFGGGFWVLDHDEVFDVYLTSYIRSQSAHNIYLEVVADHGFPGLIMYVGLIVSTYFGLFRLKWALRNKPEAEWMVNYCKMVQISLTAFMIGGNFLPLSYWDYFYHITTFATLLRAVAIKEGLLAPGLNMVPAVAPMRRPVALPRR